MRKRAIQAALAAVLLHAALLTAWSLHTDRTPAPPAQRQAMEVQWITAEVAPLPAMRQEALQMAPHIPPPRKAEAAPPARPTQRTAPERSSASLAPARAEAAAPVEAMAVQATDSPPQSRAAPAADSRTGDAVHWNAEALNRADRQERQWQRRHGTSSAAQMAAQQLAAGLGDSRTTSLGATGATREWNGSDGSRVTQVQGPGGTYCVRLPSANRLPDMGAAPRIAPVSNCP